VKTIFHVDIVYNVPDKGHAGFARKEIDLPFAPAIGSAVESVAWKRPRTVVNVTLGVDYGAPYLYVYMGSEEVSEESVGMLAYCYEGHEWTVSPGLQKASDDFATQHGYPIRSRKPEAT
jgi:hypothetical protein